MSNKHSSLFDKLKDTELDRFSKPSPRESLYFRDGIRSIDDLIKDSDTKTKALRILGLHDPFREDILEKNHFYTYSGYERDDELILLLENLGLIKADWENMEKQTHREVGHRIIEFAYEGETIKDFLNKINGKNGIIQRETLEFIAEQICSNKRGAQLYNFLKDCDIPFALLISSDNSESSEYCATYNTLITLAATQSKKDHERLFGIIEKSCNPLFYNGDITKSEEYLKRLNAMLSYNGLMIQNSKIIKTNKSNLPKAPDLPEVSISDKGPNNGIRKVIFDDQHATLIINEQKCPLPPYRNEHYFCRVIFEYEKNEFVDWSEIYEKMESGNKEPDNPQKDKRKIQDIMYALNNRVKSVIDTEETLFTWKEKSIKRNF